MNDPRLLELVKHYACLAREFSEAAAKLGRFNQFGPEFVKAMNRAEKCRTFCAEAGYQDWGNDEP